MPIEIPGCCDSQYEILRKILLSLPSISGGGGGGDVTLGGNNVFTGDNIFNGGFTVPCSIEAANRRLFDSGCDKSLDWEFRQLFDAAGGMIILDWNSQLLNNSAGTTTLNWSSQRLFHAGDPALDWSVRTLIDSAGANSVDWNIRQLLDPGALTAADWGSRILANSAGATTVDWGVKTLVDGVGGIILDWDNLLINDAANLISIDFGTRLLVNSTGGTFLDWENGTINGLVYPIADGNAGDVITTDGAGNLTLQPQTGGVSLQSGSEPIGNGLDTVTVVFPIPFTVPPNVVAIISRTSGDPVIDVDLDQDSITTTGFDAKLASVTPNADYFLQWMANGATVTPPPVALYHYLMNDNAANDVVTDVLSGFNGALVNGLNNFTSENSVAGKINLALTFDKVDDVVTSTGTFSPDFATNWTVALWFFQPVDTVGNVGTAIHVGDPVTRALIFYTNIDGGTAAACVNGAVAGDAAFYFLPAPLLGCTLPQGAWTHLVGVISGNGTLMSLYKDSVFIASTAVAPGGVVAGSKVWIGAQAGAANLVNGIVDDFRVYNSALDQSQIDFIYNGGAGTEAEIP